MLFSVNCNCKATIQSACVLHVQTQHVKYHHFSLILFGHDHLQPSTVVSETQVNLLLNLFI